jgi:hypothetical protein
MVEPVDPFEDSELNSLQRAPGSSPADDRATVTDGLPTLHSVWGGVVGPQFPGERLVFFRQFEQPYTGKGPVTSGVVSTSAKGSITAQLNQPHNLITSQETSPDLGGRGAAGELGSAFG